MIDVAVVVGSTRPGRKGRTVAEWVHTVASRRGDARYTLVDLAEVGLPLRRARPASLGDYQREHTRRWSAVVAPTDAFVLVTPEYNHGIPAALKNALDFLYAEWNDKAVGLRGLRERGGVRAVEHLRGVVGEAADGRRPRAGDLLNRTEFDASGAITPDAGKEELLGVVLDQVIRWGGALAELRRGRGDDG